MPSVMRKKVPRLSALSQFFSFFLSNSSMNFFFRKKIIKKICSAIITHNERLLFHVPNANFSKKNIPSLRLAPSNCYPVMNFKERTIINVWNIPPFYEYKVYFSLLWIHPWYKWHLWTKENTNKRWTIYYKTHFFRGHFLKCLDFYFWNRFFKDNILDI